MLWGSPLTENEWDQYASVCLKGPTKLLDAEDLHHRKSGRLLKASRKYERARLGSRTQGHQSLRCLGNCSSLRERM
jgi:hypothetical protein